jgi:phosphoribosylcarboxyaminoimidazole (NCAIR) mutase
MLDKQIYRDLEQVTPEGLARVGAAYEKVAELVGTFPQMRGGMVALLCDGPEFVSFSETVVRVMQQFGLPTVRHIAAAVRTPGYVLQLVQQLEVTFPRLICVALGDEQSMLGQMVDAATSTPVLSLWPSGSTTPDEAALECAKIFAVEDTVLYGRVLLTQASARSANLQADAQLNVPPPLPAGQLA